MTQYKNALSETISYEEKVRLMVLTTLREECGRELSKKAYYNDKDSKFDWKGFNENFQADYGDCSVVELLELAKQYYGMNNLEEIRSRRKLHKEQYETKAKKFQVA
ncbi:hypothetical protein Cri9333_0388 [Crinalium epipsammum PCC 9333]|uniref:Uncharacterized protein n=1 Tax=Crinalium epipsammum PCC 9333 TaxID=1173022 RepID=K9VV44_9CYAN|nr:hypothetical protein [Crinalium epipsammum]AFZ11362.1 hypothetical protein Cri9333_0388 [Crinalium epipsammum PCC 9333]